MSWRVSPKWNWKVISPEWSRIILQTFWATLFLQFKNQLKNNRIYICWKFQLLNLWNVATPKVTLYISQRLKCSASKFKTFKFSKRQSFKFQQFNNVCAHDFENHKSLVSQMCKHILAFKNDVVSFLYLLKCFCNKWGVQGPTSCP